VRDGVEATIKVGNDVQLQAVLHALVREDEVRQEEGGDAQKHARGDARVGLRSSRQRGVILRAPQESHARRGGR